MSVVVALLALVVIGVVLGLWIRALLELRRSTLPQTEKLVWLIVLVAVPGLGLIAWLVMRPAGRSVVGPNHAS
ncbi:hypothetical protein DSM112329_02855 [Paraconexibacter sp. AEG42_29]|uniref:Cardiolipin synthase N-terminal domain-containing protein n=1 Tax=Paraconexibacter sp. AEG42_29 TaxID=2997339 RepID=A0AAU7AWH4_9ACTN